MDSICLRKAVRMLHLHIMRQGGISRGTTSLQSAYIGGVNAPVNIRSLQSEKYDYWSLNNTPLKTLSGQYVKLKDFSSVTREVSDNTISREDQQYVITVGYDFIGNYELGRLILDKNIDETMQCCRRAIRRRAAHSAIRGPEKTNYYLIFLVILIIYFICGRTSRIVQTAVNCHQPYPFSFIGVFVTFHISIFRLTKVFLRR